MILFYSGTTSGESLPERVFEKEGAEIMITYWEIDEKRGDAARRLKKHIERIQNAEENKS